MEIKMNPRKDFPGRGPCIEMIGDWVTEEVWGVVNRLLIDNWMNSPVYKAKIPAQPFFQGGHNDSKGKWILIEFWAEEEKCQDFIKILNEEVNKVIKEDFTYIRLVAKTMNTHHIVEVEEASELIAEETGCNISMSEQDRHMHMCRVMFKPKDNVQYRAVSLHVDYTFKLSRVYYLDKWEVNNPQGEQQIEVRV